MEGPRIFRSLYGRRARSQPGPQRAGPTQQPAALRRRAPGSRLTRTLSAACRLRRLAPPRWRRRLPSAAHRPQQATRPAGMPAQRRAGMQLGPHAVWPAALPYLAVTCSAVRRQAHPKVHLLWLSGRRRPIAQGRGQQCQIGSWPAGLRSTGLPKRRRAAHAPASSRGRRSRERHSRARGPMIPEISGQGSGWSASQRRTLAA